MITSGDIAGDHNGCSCNDSQVSTQLLILKYTLKFFQKQKEIQVKIDTKQDHKYGDHTINVGTVEVCHTCIVTGKSSGTGSAECMCHCVKQVHPSCQKKNYLNCSQCKIHSIQDPCGSSCLWNQFICLWPRNFRTHQMHGILLIQRGKYHNKYQHSHSTNPMCQGTPEKNSFRKSFNLSQDRRTCRRKSGYCFKKSIHIAWNTFTEYKWKCTCK